MLEKQIWKDAEQNAEQTNSPIQVVIKNNPGWFWDLGMIAAAIISYHKWQSIGWAIWHFCLGWAYVIYYIVHWTNLFN